MCSFQGVAEKLGGLHPGSRGPRSSLGSEPESVLGGQLSGEREEAWLLLARLTWNRAAPTPARSSADCAHTCPEETAQVPVPKRGRQSLWTEQPEVPPLPSKPQT